MSPMIFILVTDVLTSLVKEAENRLLLQPLIAAGRGERLSLYTDDVILFASTDLTELSTIREILRCFDMASGLHTNIWPNHLQFQSNVMSRDSTTFKEQWTTS